jgi:polyisoprenoid-binding protein YceI
MTNSISRASALVLLVALGGCESPAAGKPKAEVGSAKPTATSTAAQSGESYTLAASSKVDFVGSKVTGKHDGGFKKVSGSAKLAGGKPEGGSVEVEIDTTSVYSDDEKLTGHLKSGDFFDVEKHPTAKFVSTSIEKGGEGGSHTVTGNLTLRGKTKSIKFPATITQSGDTITVKSEFSINRKDFDIVYAGKADDLIRDDVVIKLELDLKKG